MKLAQVQGKIYEVRGMRIMLDYDLATLYETETKHLKQAVRRNIDRFPEDFMFELTKEEFVVLRSQIVTLETEGRGTFSKYLPFAFTEQGVAMLSSVIHSKKAIQVNISIMRAFVLIREFALNYNDLSNQLKQLDEKYEDKFLDVYQAINYLIGDQEEQKMQNERKKIGFKV